MSLNQPLVNWLCAAGSKRSQSQHDHPIQNDSDEQHTWWWFAGKCIAESALPMFAQEPAFLTWTSFIGMWSFSLQFDIDNHSIYYLEQKLLVFSNSCASFKEEILPTRDFLIPRAGVAGWTIIENIISCTWWDTEDIIFVLSHWGGKELRKVHFAINSAGTMIGF